MVTHSHSILARWRNIASQLCNVYGVSNVRQTDIHTAEPLVPGPSALDVEIAIENIKGHKLLGIDQILAELIKAGDRTISVIKQTVAIIDTYDFRQLRTKFCPTSCCQG